jgi:hypothetical protein
MSTSNEIESGATGVITHRVREGQQENYENWLKEIIPVCRSSPGHLDWQVIRPITGLTSTYTVIIRFDTYDHLHQWLNSPVRQKLLEKARPFLSKDDNFFIRSGLDFWFTPEGAKALVPRRWKQFLVTWAAIYPVSLLSQVVLSPWMLRNGVPENIYFKTFLTTGIVVFLMVYVVMPKFTKLLKRWLFK